MELTGLIFSILCVVIAVFSEAMRRAVDGRENALIYGSKRHELHDIQDLEGKLGYVTCSAAACGVFAALASSWWALGAAPLTGALVGFSASLYGNYYFQREINRAFGKPDVDPEEAPTWYSPRQGKGVPKLFYGTRRRWQRQVAVGLGAVAAGGWLTAHFLLS